MCVVNMILKLEMKTIAFIFCLFSNKVLIKMGTWGTRVLTAGEERYKEGRGKGKEEPCEIGSELEVSICIHMNS